MSHNLFLLKKAKQWYNWYEEIQNIDDKIRALHAKRTHYINKSQDAHHELMLCVGENIHTRLFEVKPGLGVLVEYNRSIRAVPIIKSEEE